MCNLKNIIMEKTKKLFNYLAVKKEYAFTIISVIAALLVSYFMYCSTAILILAILFTLLALCIINITSINVSKLLRYGLALVCFSLCTICCSLCYTTNCGEGTYQLGLIVYMIVKILYMSSIPYLVKKLSTNVCGKAENMWHAHIITVVIYLIIFCIYAVGYENPKIDDARFAKEQFVDVKSWTIEQVDGNTVYIVTTAKGKFAIYPKEVPEVRDIHKNTKMRILSKGNSHHIKGTKHIERIEIKN